MWIDTEHEAKSKCPHKYIIVLFGPTREVPTDNGKVVTAVVGSNQLPLNEMAELFYIYPASLAGKRCTGVREMELEWLKRLEERGDDESMEETPEEPLPFRG
jgi:hypothetical protein